MRGARGESRDSGHPKRIPNPDHGLGRFHSASRPGRRRAAWDVTSGPGAAHTRRAVEPRSHGWRPKTCARSNSSARTCLKNTCRSSANCAAGCSRYDSNGKLTVSTHGALLVTSPAARCRQDIRRDEPGTHDRGRPNGESPACRPERAPAVPAGALQVAAWGGFGRVSCRGRVGRCRRGGCPIRNSIWRRSAMRRGT